ncbi:MAG: anaerobic ribonucleoside-triphosphate reductase [Candidatus Bathyarchaeia archaeon]
MPRRRRSGLKVLKASSSSIRMKILNLLFERGALSYTEIMSALRLNPTRDAGRFAYHLKLLLKANLIDPDVKTRKYVLTDLGRMMVDITEDIEQQFLKRKKMAVRTSRLAIEEFDRSKIVDSLVKEANVPIDLAQKIARETEGRLSEFKTKYLTAPLIREFVNAILVEKGLEEYRHKLTRLGLPVHDVTQLITSIGEKSLGVEAVHKAAGDAVIEEYTLLNVLPRDIADAHLSGKLHVNHLGCWILKMNEFMHDLRFFLQHGIDLGGIDFMAPSYPPPKNLASALLMVSNILKIAATEISGEQAFDYFNIFLAPFANGLSEKRVREDLRMFVLNLNQSLSNEGFPIATSLGLEFIVPDFLGEKGAIGPDGRKTGRYEDFIEESRLIASILLETMFEDDKHKPIFNPSLIMKIRPEVLRSKECHDLLYNSHRLAAERGLPYFANLSPKDEQRTSYTATGCRFGTDWKEDWELDTLRTGSVDNIIINLPRASYDAGRSRSAFFEILDERLEMALRALEIKYQTIKQRSREGLLPFLSQKAGDNHYFRLENSSRLVSFVGLNEMVHSLLDKSIHDDSEATVFAEEVLKYLSKGVRGYTRKPETRASLSILPSTDAAGRLAELDVENCGWAKVHAEGTREQPFYTDMVAVPLTTEIPWKDRLSIEEKFHELTHGGHLALLQLADSERDPHKLLSATREIVRMYNVGLYAFNKHLAYCANCKRTFNGILAKCPDCGSVNMLVCFSRVSAKHKPSYLWNPPQRSALNNRISYVFNSE